MNPLRGMIASSVLLLCALLQGRAMAEPIPSSPRAQAALKRVAPAIDARLLALGASKPTRLYLRIFKQEGALEAWVATAQGYRLFASYPICSWSGRLGGKHKEGDLQAPEGIYEIRAKQLNPSSRFHLSFNLGFPNAYERAQGFTGSDLMVHGNCVSIGCYAMTDPLIEEIYALVSRALAGGQSAVPVHAFPFRMSAENLLSHQKRARTPADRALWRQLQAVYQAYSLALESKQNLPKVSVTVTGYVLRK